MTSYMTTYSGSVSSLDPKLKQTLLSAGFSFWHTSNGWVWHTPKSPGTNWELTEPGLKRIVAVVTQDPLDLPLYIANPRDSRLLSMLMSILRERSLWHGVRYIGDDYWTCAHLSEALTPLWVQMLMLEQNL